MTAPFIIGWEEWVSLPDLGLPAVKAKVDTGARTSALHAHNIEPFGPAGAPLVRFTVHPIAGKTDIEINCSAPIVDRREVTSSNGEREARYVILTHVRMGARTWPIEMTLTDRQAMTYRMLLGRQAIQDDMFVDAASSFRQPKLAYKPYRHMPRRDPVRRALRIALLASNPDGPGTTAIAAAAAARGHVVETIALTDIALAFDSIVPGLLQGGAPVGHFDIVIPRFDPVRHPRAVAVLRQMEMMGSVALNPADAMTRLADPIAMRQVLYAAGVGMDGPARIAAAGDVRVPGIPAEPDGDTACVLVVGHNALAVRVPLDAGQGTREGAAASTSPAEVRPVRRLAVKAARALRLRLATVDVVVNGDAVRVARVCAFPQLAHFVEATGIAIERDILADAEKMARSWVRHTGTEEDGDSAPQLPDDDTANTPSGGEAT